MKPDSAPTIYSFIIRFVVEDAAQETSIQPAYHGAVRHIQSGEEVSFNHWQEVVEFVQRFVPLEDLTQKSSD
jgi:hypothetical protein